jgi:uncharacterized protein (TIGR03435 family)
MRNRCGGTRDGRRKSFFEVASAVVLGLTLSVGIAAPAIGAQSAPNQTATTQASPTPSSAAPLPPPQWQIDAGGKMEFDVVSVKQDTAPMSPQTVSSNFPLGPGNMYTPNGGLFTATNYPLISYIAFAYKLGTFQLTALVPLLPKWAMSDRYDIQARASGNPGKDQMRLMMQALLADRFKLAIHTETRQLPVFALVLVKPGTTGPQLRPYPDGSPCDTSAPTGTNTIPQGPPAMVPGGFPVICGGYAGMQPSVPGRIHVGARNVTIQIIADQFPGLLNSVDRPVIDKTGLVGTFDFSIEFTPEVPAGANFHPNETGPTFLEALKEQLGLKMDSTTGPVNVIVVDHIEQPSEN